MGVTCRALTGSKEGERKSKVESSDPSSLHDIIGNSQVIILVMIPH